MEPNAPCGGFRLIPFSFKGRTIRFLVSENVLRRVPQFQEVLFRAATTDSIVWPPSIVICGEDESLKAPSDALKMVLPEWFFQSVAEENHQTRSWWKRLLGGVVSRRAAWNAATCFGFYLRPLQTDSRIREHCPELIDMNIFMPFRYRPFSMALRSVVLLPVGVVFLGAMPLASFVFPNNPRLLFARGKMQLVLNRRHGLSRTRQRLRELGVPEEKLKGLTLPAQLKEVQRASASRVVTESTENNGKGDSGDDRD